MEQNAEDLVAQEAAARDYQPQIEVNILFFLLVGACLSCPSESASVFRRAFPRNEPRAHTSAPRA